MYRIALPLILLCAAGSAQTTSSFTFNVTATVATGGTSYGITATGTGTLTGYGTAQLLATGTITTLSGLLTTTPIPMSVTMIFGSGDVLSGQLVIPAGFLIPQLGQPASAAVTFTIQGGTGGFANASGYFPTLTLSTGATGTITTVQGNGSGLVYAPASHVSGTPSYAGSFAHFASGGGWDTIITLVNKGTTSAQAQVNFYTESGAPSPLPLDFPQGASPTTASTYTTVLKPGAVAIIDSQGGATTSVGSAQLLSDGKVSGYLVFRYVPTLQEAAVPLQLQNSTTYTLPFDNTNGISTGIAMATASTTSTTVQILVTNDQGAQIATDTIVLPGLGHHQFVLGTNYPASNSVRGTIQFQVPAGSQIGVIGIRALASGAYTTIPPIGN
jgi:hypothetical protein